MRILTTTGLCLAALTAMTSMATAGPREVGSAHLFDVGPSAPPAPRWHIDWMAGAGAQPVAPRVDFRSGDITAPVAQQPVQVPFEYSDGYRVRAKIHRLASWASLPLFATQVVIGQQMFNDGTKATERNRSIHKWTGISVVSLFGVNSVTGLWNLIEARKDPNGKTLRVIHATLMMVADAGFAASAATSPRRSGDGLLIYDQKKNQHMALSYAAISVATVGYLIMLFQ